MAAITEKEVIQYVSLRTGSGAVLLTEFYMVGDDDDEHFIAVKPIEVISLGFNLDDNNELHENLIYRKYIRFSDDEECTITDVETVAKLSPTAEAYYLTKIDELYPKTEEEEIPEDIKDKVNVVIGNFSKSNKKMH